MSELLRSWRLPALTGWLWIKSTPSFRLKPQPILRVIDSCGVVPLVRLTSNDPNQIKRVMDAGAHGTYGKT